MTPVPPNLDQNFEQPEPPPDPATIAAEEESRRQRAARERAERDMKLENIMLRAGLDPQSTEHPMNKLFFDGYDGELTADAVVERATGYGLLNQPAPPTGDVTDPAERQQTQDRQVAAGGAKPDGETPSEDPRLAAVRVGQDLMDAGATQEAAFGKAFDTIAAAGFGDRASGRAPDPRAQWEPGKEDPRRPDPGW
jgi:hypothetical protein